jgi:hypothetical protein
MTHSKLQRLRYQARQLPAGPYRIERARAGLAVVADRQTNGGSVGVVLAETNSPDVAELIGVALENLPALIELAELAEAA